MSIRAFALAGTVLIAGLSPAALVALSPCTTVIMIHALLPTDAPAVLSASERVVWDRQTGTAIAEVPSDNLVLLPAGLKFASVAAPLNFQSALDEALPSYRAEGVDGTRFAAKEPSAMVRPVTAPQRPANQTKQGETTTCLFEGFELLPIWVEDGGPWFHYQGCAYGGSGCTAVNNVGNYFWLDVTCDHFQGNYDVEAVMGGTNGQTLPCAAAYPAHTDSWFEYRPEITCVAGVPQASLNVAGKVLTNNTQSDFLFYGFSPDGTNYNGYNLSGNWSDTWYSLGGNMRNWSQPAMDLTTYPFVYVAFVLRSGNRPGPGFGARLDNISISATALSAVASADKTTGHPPLTVYFSGSVMGGQAPFSYSWNFDDGSPTSSEQNPVHAYTAVGTYHPRLTVVDANGAMSTGGLTITVSIVAPPVVSSMSAATGPFRFIVNGVNFQPGIAVYINGHPWSTITWKSSNKLVIKGGASLKAAAPKGVPATFLFENSDGDTATFTFGW